MVLHRRGHFAVDAGLKTRVPRMVIASALLGVALLVSQGQMESLLAGVLTRAHFGPGRYGGYWLDRLRCAGSGDAHSYGG